MENVGCQDSFSSCLLSTHPKLMSVVLHGHCPLPPLETKLGYCTQRVFQIPTHVSSYSAHPMHMRNWFTGVRAGAHVSISSSTELKFYHLFVFKAKNIQLTLQGKKSWQRSFPLAGLGYSSPAPTHTAEPSAWSAQESGGNEMHMSASPSPAPVP